MGCSYHFLCLCAFLGQDDPKPDRQKPPLAVWGEAEIQAVAEEAAELEACTIGALIARIGVPLKGFIKATIRSIIGYGMGVLTIRIGLGVYNTKTIIRKPPK